MASQKLSLRRLRQNQHIRELVSAAAPEPKKMIQPLFVVENLAEQEPVPGLPGVYRETPESLLRTIENDLEAGVNKFLLFGVPKTKRERDFDSDFSASQIQAIKKRFGSALWLAGDVCLCSSTSHGQCGVLSPENDHIENGATVSALARSALAFAQAGADSVAPSDMMDGRVAAIREALDSSGCERTLIMSYSAKFHSKFYGPFRVAADSTPRGPSTLKDRATYQIDPGRFNDALLSSLRDSEEGADILMVKPGLPYLDVLARLSEKITKPWAVYEVSGEYAAVEALARDGLMNGPLAHIEAWTAFGRAGASIIITYGARHARDWLSL